MNNLLNVIWPAMYVSETFWRFWYLMIATVVIESLVLRYILKFSWKKSFLASLAGNLMSGLAGTFLTVFGMLGWHAVADNFLPHGTFSQINWITTFVLMCLGSVLIETKTVSLIYKERAKRLFAPMLTGNLLTYVFIAITMSASAEKAEVKRIEKVKYVSDTNKFMLLNRTLMTVDTSYIEIWYNKRNERTDNPQPGYRLQIPFHKERQDEYTVSLRLLEDESGDGIYNNVQQLFVKEIEEEFKIVLEQRNPNPKIGWDVPIETDTLTLKRLSPEK